MNIRIILLCIAFLSIPSQVVNSADDERTVMIENLVKGDLLVGDNEVIYQHLPELRAELNARPSASPQQVNSILVESGVELIETKGKYVLFKIPALQPALLRGRGKSKSYAVVLNKRTKEFGILTGLQIVTLLDMANAKKIANDYGIGIVTEFSHLRTVFFQIGLGTNIANLTNKLKLDPRVENTYPEIIEHFVMPL